MKQTALLALALSLVAFCLPMSGAQKIYLSSISNPAPAVVVTDSVPLLHTAQILPSDKHGEIRHAGNAEKQSRLVIERLEELLKTQKSALKNVVKINAYLAAAAYKNSLDQAFLEVFGKNLPAISYVETALPRGAFVALDAVAEVRASQRRYQLSHISRIDSDPATAEAALLPQAGAVFISGQAKPGDLSKATRKTLESLEQTLLFVGLKKTNIVQLKAFMHPMTEMNAVREIILQFFGDKITPPLVFVEWKSQNLPIEIELIARSPGASDASEPVSFLTPPGVQASPVFSRIARVNYGRLAFTSGLYGTSSDKPHQEVEQIFENLRKAIELAGSNFDSLAKATYYVSNPEASAKLNELRPQYYSPTRPPTASKAMVAGVAENARSVTLDIIAVTEP